MDTNGREYAKSVVQAVFKPRKTRNTRKNTRGGKRQNHEWTRMGTKTCVDGALGRARAASCKFLCAIYITLISLRGRVFIMLISKRFNLVSLLTLVLRPAGG